MPGFIPGSRGSLMLDLVATAMIAVLPLLTLAIMLVKKKKAYNSHRILMLGISVALAVAVFLFELEMRLVGWRHLAEPSPYYDNLMPVVLGVHLVCSVTTVVLISMTVWNATRKFPNPPKPNAHSAQHKKLGKLTALGLVLTSITGWAFYYVAFVAS
jgi:uncharacterized membrane protein YozB (DUF420 family)